jgi:hypothetical protein
MLCPIGDALSKAAIEPLREHSVSESGENVKFTSNNNILDVRHQLRSAIILSQISTVFYVDLCWVVAGWLLT